MQDLFNIALDMDDVVELDSSTDSKFSRHLIVPLRNAAFANNSHVGAFVGGLLEGAQGCGDGLDLVVWKVRSNAW